MSIKVKDLCDALQTYANNGFAIHNVSIHVKCKDCDSDILIEEPLLKIVEESNGESIRLRFYSEGCE